VFFSSYLLIFTRTRIDTNLSHWFRHFFGDKFVICVLVLSFDFCQRAFSDGWNTGDIILLFVEELQCICMSIS